MFESGILPIKPSFPIQLYDKKTPAVFKQRVFFLQYNNCLFQIPPDGITSADLKLLRLRAWVQTRWTWEA